MAMLACFQWCATTREFGYLLFCFIGCLVILIKGFLPEVDGYIPGNTFPV